MKKIIIAIVIAILALSVVAGILISNNSSDKISQKLDTNLIVDKMPPENNSNIKEGEMPQNNEKEEMREYCQENPDSAECQQMLPLPEGGFNETSLN